jgi:sugar phosphate isomerase/epimerase
MLTSLPLDFDAALRRVAELGFSHVDVVALAERPPSHLESLAESGLVVACTPLGRGLPDGWGLDVPSVELRRATLEILRRQTDDAARLGATCGYLVPPTAVDEDALTRFADGCRLLSEYAGQRQVRLCVEPVPGRALSEASRTFDWLERNSLDGVSLLLDVGHCLISREEPAAVVRRAGRRLGYVHLDDNDGVGDLHWPLFAGRLTRETLHGFLVALAEIAYGGPLAFEFNPALDDPVAALREGRKALHESFAD